MDKKIKQILGELYELDPQLQAHEGRLVQIVQKLLIAKPDTRFDKTFARELRVQLLGQSKVATLNSFNFNIMKKFGYMLGGAAITAILVVPVVLPNFLKQKSGSFAELTGSSITLLGDEAFGNFGQNGDDGASKLAMPESNIAVDTMMVDSFMPAPTAEPSPALSTRPQSGGGGLTSGSIGIAPDRMIMAVDFNYVYVGEEINLEQEKLEVLRKKIVKPSASGLVGQLGLNLIDLSRLSGSELENVVITESQGDGTRIQIDFNSGSIFVNKNGRFMNGIQELYKQFKTSDILPDDKLIKIANSFVNQFGINVSGYGEPEVSSQTQQFISMAQTNPEFYVPETAIVVYPLSINGIRVYDQGGNLVGVNVAVNMRAKEVLSVSGLTSQNYDASLYPVNGDIGGMIAKYNDRFAYPKGATVEKREIKLGTPELVYIAVSQFSENREQQLLVPAYRFSIVDQPEEYNNFQASLVIPLVQSFGQEQYPTIIPGIPGIEVMMNDVMDEESSGSEDSVSAPPAVEAEIYQQ